MKKIYYLFFLFFLVTFQIPNLYSVKIQPFEVSTLPTFSHDFSELVISSIIEKGSVVRENLNLFVVFMGHKALRERPQLPFLMYNHSIFTKTSWTKVLHNWDKSMEVDLNHTSRKLFLRVKNIQSHEKDNNSPIPCSWLPTQTVPDPGFIKKLEFLRCPLSILRPTLIKKNPKLVIEILRASSSITSEGSSFQSLLTFKVPWRTRITGFGLNLRPPYTSLNPWETKQSSPKHSLSRSPPKVWMCTPVLRPLEVHRADVGLPMLLEFVEHSVLLGFDHVFLGLQLHWSSLHFARHFLALHQHYILPSLLTLSSLSLSSPSLSPSLSTNPSDPSDPSPHQAYDDVSGFLGMSLLDDYSKWIFENQCLALARGGVADYVAFFHASEFLVLQQSLLMQKRSIRSIQEMILWAELKIHTPPVQRARDQYQDLEGRSEDTPPPLPPSSHLHTPCYYVFPSIGVPDPTSSPPLPDLIVPGSEEEVYPQYFSKQREEILARPSLLHYKSSSLSDPRRGPGDAMWTSQFFAGSALIGPLPAWAGLVAPVERVELVAWHVGGVCYARSVSISAHQEATTGLDPSISEETHPSRVSQPHFPWDRVVPSEDAAFIPPDIAALYYYRGDFDPWQLEKRILDPASGRPSRLNNHTRLYRDIVRSRLRDKGYRFISSESSKDKVGLVLDSPYIYYIQLQKRNPHIPILSPSPLSTSSMRNHTYLLTLPFTSSTQPSPSYLGFFSEQTAVNEDSKDSLLIGIPPPYLLPSGQRALRDSRTWKECDRREGCRYMADLILPPSPYR